MATSGEIIINYVLTVELLGTGKPSVLRTEKTRMRKHALLWASSLADEYILGYPQYELITKKNRGKFLLSQINNRILCIEISEWKG